MDKDCQQLKEENKAAEILIMELLHRKKSEHGQGVVAVIEALVIIAAIYMLLALIFGWWPVADWPM